jgi:acid stress chaperone HdeB
MKRTLTALLIFGLTAATHASSVNLSKMTCQEFLASEKDEIRIILAWLDGYYTDEQDPPIIETETLIGALGRLNDYCSANPTVSLIIAADKVFRK